MKSLLCFLLLCLAHSLWGQDMMILTTEEVLAGEVLKIQGQSVKIAVSDSFGVYETRIPKSRIRLVRYADGMEQYFAAQYSPAPILPPAPLRASFPETDKGHHTSVDGFIDGQMAYQSRGAFWGSYGATVFYPGLGLITGALTTVLVCAIPSKIQEDRLPDPAAYQQNEAYAKGFRKGVKHKKIKRAVTGFLAGVGTQVVAILAFFAIFFF